MAIPVWGTGHLYRRGEIVTRYGVKYQATTNVETDADPAIAGPAWVAPEPLAVLAISLNTDGTVPGTVVSGGGTVDLQTLDALGVATDVELAVHVAASNPHPAYATDADLTAHEADTTNVHGIAAASALVLTNDARLADARTPLAHLHTIADSTDLQSSLDVKAALGHNHDGSYATTGHTHAGTSIPTGLIAMWGGLVANIPSGWLLCDGQNGTPDLRSRFVKGANAGQDPGGTGGATTHGHTVTQPGSHSLLTHSAHSGATVGNHAFTQPSAHSDHALLSHSAHSGATVGNHADVTNHVHGEQLQGGTTGTTTGTHLMGSAATGGSLRSAGQSTLNPTSVGVAAMVHSVGQASAHSDHAAAAHTAHSGGAVDAHSVGQAGAHTDHAAQTHSGAAVDTVNSEPAYYALCFIQKT